MGTQGIATNCNNLKQFYFLRPDATGNAIDGSFSAGSFVTSESKSKFNHESEYGKFKPAQVVEQVGRITLQQSADSVLFGTIFPNCNSVFQFL